MARKALIIGGSGQIGRATAKALLADGWAVTAGQKSPTGFPDDLRRAGVEVIHLDREEPGVLPRIVYGGFDAVIDTVAYDDRHARQLLAVQGDVGAFVVISTGSVYADAQGRTLDEAASGGFPQYPVPIAEDQARTTPGLETYSTRKVLMEDVLLAEAQRPVILLRPFAIYGPGSRHPREWWFVRRILDGRRRIPLAWAGESRFHQSATANIAELTRVALQSPQTQALNAADPQALSVREIGEAIAAAYGVTLDFALLDGPPVKGVGATPWSVAAPLVADMSRAEALGYRPVATYAQAVGEACRSAEAAAKAGVEFPAYINAMFDYAAEDAVLGR
ncbi:NAD-dependent epimerase/dehydratase family protein [Caulobacter sp. KR2-114]|uniref:NAD-dependent epimerase/dehydratase family protein n=1 Tax=Caulobacter sp. KR2-114 TaxID=3400912 RepID=UPI003BFFD7D8